MKIIQSHMIYENPVPQLRARNATFPFCVSWKMEIFLHPIKLGSRV